MANEMPAAAVAETVAAANVEGEGGQRGILVRVDDTMAVVIGEEDFNTDRLDMINQLLAMEMSSQDTWLQVGYEFYKRGNYDAFKDILTNSLEPAFEQVFTDRLKERFSYLRDSVPLKYQMEVRQEISRFRENKVKLRNARAACSIEEAMKICIASTDSRQQADEKKKKLMNLETSASNDINESLQANAENGYTIVLRGLLQFHKKRYRDARETFKNALQADPQNVPAMLGRACTQFHRNTEDGYKEALRIYRQALRLHPGCVGIRNGIGMCLHRLGRSTRARQAFERVLSLEADNVVGLVCLANCLINQKDKDVAAVQKGITLLKKAYRLNPTNSMLCNLLAFVNFYHGNYKTVEVLTRRAFDFAPSPRTRAEAYYQIARCYHARGGNNGKEQDQTQKQNFIKEAGRLYAKAVEQNPKHYLAQFGLGQIHVLKGRRDEAIKCMESVFHGHPENHQAMRILGSLYLGKRRFKEGQKLLHKAVKYFPNDVSLFVELAESYERINPVVALEHYDKAIKVLTEKKQELPYQLWNNVGVLKHLLGKSKVAKSAFKQAREKLLQQQQQQQLQSNTNDGPKNNADGDTKNVAKSTTTSKDDTTNQMEIEQDEAAVSSSSSSSSSSSQPPVLASIQYNTALVAERSGDFEEAEKIYKDISAKYPSYIDAHLRLGCVKQVAMEYTDAEHHFKKALETIENKVKRVIPGTNSRSSSYLDALSLLGNLYLEMGELEKAEKCFQDIVKSSKKSKNDCYANLALADIYFRSSLKGSTEKEKKEKFQKAHNIFQTTIERDPKNIYAANGMGVALVLFKQVEAAKKVFKQVQDAEKDMPAAWVNLGHVYTHLKQYPNAVQSYEHALVSFPDSLNRVEMYLYIAKAHYLAENTEECKTALTKALHLAPRNSQLWYNLGIALEHDGVRRVNNHCTLEELLRAIKVTKQAADVYHKVHATCTAAAAAAETAKATSGEAKDTTAPTVDEADKEEAPSALAERALTHYNYCIKGLETVRRWQADKEEEENAARKIREETMRKAQELERAEEERSKKEKEDREAERKRREEQYELEMKRFEEEKLAAVAAASATAEEKEGGEAEGGETANPNSTSDAANASVDGSTGSPVKRNESFSATNEGDGQGGSSLQADHDRNEEKEEGMMEMDKEEYAAAADDDEGKEVVGETQIFGEEEEEEEELGGEIAATQRGPKDYDDDDDHMEDSLNTNTAATTTATTNIVGTSDNSADDNKKGGKGNDDADDDEQDDDAPLSLDVDDEDDDDDEIEDGGQKQGVKRAAEEDVGDGNINEPEGSKDEAPSSVEGSEKQKPHARKRRRVIVDEEEDED